MNRFSLRFLLLLIAIVAAGVVIWERSETRQARRAKRRAQRQAMAWIGGLGGELWLHADDGFGEQMPNAKAYSRGPEPKVSWFVVFPGETDVDDLRRLEVFDQLRGFVVWHRNFYFPESPELRGTKTWDELEVAVQEHIALFNRIPKYGEGWERGVKDAASPPPLPKPWKDSGGILPLKSNQHDFYGYPVSEEEWEFYWSTRRWMSERFAGTDP